MDGASFAKLCRDSSLLGGKLNTTAVDIAFSKAKAKVCEHPKLLHMTRCLLVVADLNVARHPLQLCTRCLTLMLGSCFLSQSHVWQQHGNHCLSLNCGVKKNLTSEVLNVQGARRMSFKEFENALELLASNKGVSGEQLRQQVAASAGPLCNATQAAAVRLHDDKSTYTGQL